MSDPSATTGLDLSRFVRPGDNVLVANGTGEPRTLTELLVDQRSRLGGVSVFLGATFSSTFLPEHADHLRFCALGGMGKNSVLARAGVLDVLPCHVSSLPSLIQSGRLPVDVVFAQVAPAGADGCHPLSLVSDYLPAAISAARTVVVEINELAPDTLGADRLPQHRIDGAVRSSRPPVEVPPSPAGEVEQRIAGLVAELVPDGSVLQLGIGSTPQAIGAALTAKRDLSVHSGIVGDWLVGLHQSGAVNNLGKSIDTGVSVTGGLFGSSVLFEFAHLNPVIQFRPVSYTHSPSVLARLDGLIAINSAVEVDLTGQVNSETAAGNHVGAVGGQVDFVRAAMSSPGGRSIIVLPSSAKGGTVSRIVHRLPDAVVTTARSDADLVVTEHGVADLRGLTLRARAGRLAEVAGPEFRSDLAAEIKRRRMFC